MVVTVVFIHEYYTVLDVYYAVCLVGHTTLMSDNNDGHVLLIVKSLQKVHDLYTRLRVKSSCRLVCKNYLGMSDKCPRYSHTLLLTS